jgi:hypothetical protein
MKQSLSVNLNCLLLLFTSTNAFLKLSNRYVNIAKLQRQLNGNKHQLFMSENVYDPPVIDDDNRPTRDYSIKVYTFIYVCMYIHMYVHMNIYTYVYT